MLSQTSEYALRAVVLLASNEATPRTASDLALETRVPPGYLAKVLHKLARGQIVRSQRGLHGGYVLARPAREISVLEVVNAVDPIKRIVSCPLAIDSHGTTLCRLHSRLDHAIAAIERTFGQSRVSDLLEPGTGAPLCVSAPRAKRTPRRKKS